MASRMQGSSTKPTHFVRGMDWANAQADLLGYDVIDALDPIEVDLSDIDIEKGTRGDQMNCAFAECVKREYDASEVWIGRTFAFFVVPEDEVIWRMQTPASIRLEELAGDRMGEMQPGVYKFLPVNESNRLGHGRRSRDTGKGSKHRRHHVKMTSVGIRRG